MSKVYRNADGAILIQAPSGTLTVDETTAIDIYHDLQAALPPPEAADSPGSEKPKADKK